MQFTTVLALALTGTAALAAPQGSTQPPTAFPADIQTSIQTLQGYIQNVMKDFAQNADQQTLTTDYSSTGRSLDFFLRNTFLPDGPNACPQAVAGEPLPAQATTNDEANQYLQQTQLALIAVSQDAINSQFQQGIYDACQAVRLYGGAAMSH